MRHRCDEFWLLNKRCPGRHPWEEPEDDDEEEGIPIPDEPFYLMLPERSNTEFELVGLEQLAAEAFLMEWSAAVPWRDRYPKAAIDYGAQPGYFLPDPFGDAHVDYPNQPAYVQPGPDQTVIVRGTYYTGDNGYAAEMFALAAAALLGLSGAYIVAQGSFQNLTSYMMGRYLTAPAAAGPPSGKGYFFEAPTFQGSPGDVFDNYTPPPAGEQPPTWY